MSHSGGADREWKARLAELASLRDRYWLDGLLIYASMLRRENVRYFSGFNPQEPGAIAFFGPDVRATLLLPTPAERSRASSSSRVLDIVSYDGDFRKIPPALSWCSPLRRLGIGGWESLPSNLAASLLKAFPGLELVDLTPPLDAVRIIKAGPEIDKIRKAAAIADAAFEELVGRLKPGIKEYEIVAQVEHHIRKAHGEDNFQILAASSGDARAMHPPTDRALLGGDLLVTEISPQFEGYYAQICRTVSIGTASPERRRAHGILLAAQQEALDRVRPGMTASDVARIQNDVFRREGFGEFVSERYTRGRGHGIGLYIDEEPLIAEGNEFPLAPGMVIMIHPNTFLPLAGYMVAGDPVLITETGGERLSRSRRDLISTGGGA